MKSRAFVILTGLSGAGKTLALRCLEDLNYFCVDNLLPALIPKFAQLCTHSEETRVAVVIDIRGREFFGQVDAALKALPAQGYRPLIVFLDATDTVLVRRFSATHRTHPLAPRGRILTGIQAERRLLAHLKERADKVLDTSALSPQALTRELTALVSRQRNGKAAMHITIVAFGYKHGLPLDADLVFDVRFLPNPYYEPTLSALTGNDPKVRRYILSTPESKRFLPRLFALCDFLVPQFLRTGKTQLTIAIGCTGGRHRSITVANALGAHLKQRTYRVTVEHRDVRKKP